MLIEPRLGMNSSRPAMIPRYSAPGVNAAIRAVTRCAFDQSWKVFGVQHGYAGLIEGNFPILV
jgi:hypothetical protein